MKIITTHPTFYTVTDSVKTIIFKRGFEDMLGWFDNIPTAERIMFCTRTMMDCLKKELTKEYNISTFIMSPKDQLCYIAD